MVCTAPFYMLVKMRNLSKVYVEGVSKAFPQGLQGVPMSSVKKKKKNRKIVAPRLLHFSRAHISIPPI